jgi:hypothetical protein
MSTKVVKINELIHPHPMDNFLDKTFRALKQRREKNAFVVKPKKNAPVSY